MSDQLLFPDLSGGPPAPRPGDILSCDEWPTNGHLITDVARLGYLTADMVTLDVTHGRGVFWRQWSPNRLVRMSYPQDEGRAAHDIDADMLALPFRSHSFDAVVFDPPYQPAGSPGQLAGMMARYGIANTSAADIWTLMSGGMAEVVRVVRPGGRIITKAGRGVNGGELWRGDDRLVELAERLGCRVVTQFRMVTRPRAQGHRGPQKSPRSNYSTLTVLDAPTAVPA